MLAKRRLGPPWTRERTKTQQQRWGIFNFAGLEGVYRANRAIEKRRLFLQEPPCGARFRQNLQHTVDSRNQFAAA
jgi:hypothetical protein